MTNVNKTELTNGNIFFCLSRMIFIHKNIVMVRYNRYIAYVGLEFLCFRAWSHTIGTSWKHCTFNIKKITESRIDRRLCTLTGSLSKVVTEKKNSSLLSGLPRFGSCRGGVGAAVGTCQVCQRRCSGRFFYRLLYSSVNILLVDLTKAWLWLVWAVQIRYVDRSMENL